MNELGNLLLEHLSIDLEIKDVNFLKRCLFELSEHLLSDGAAILVLRWQPVAQDQNGQVYVLLGALQPPLNLEQRFLVRVVIDYYDSVVALGHVVAVNGRERASLFLQGQL